MTEQEGYELKVKIQRDAHGIPHVEADCEANMYWGQGWCHAEDRGMQMTLMRILGQGRASELLDSSAETLGVDTFFRRMNWTGNTEEQLNLLSENNLENLQAYCDGANAAFAKKFPWEFKMLGVKHELWQPKDIIMMARMIGYLTLAQSQWEIERLLVEMIQANIPQAKLEELFPGQLGELDIDLIKKVKLQERIVPPEILWGKGLPRMMASNNWVVGGKKTASGKPIVVNDPHLEVNRLPNIWMEIVMGTEDNYFMGGSMPGVPGIPVGRTKHVAWGATYAFIDACDSWVEQCKEGNFYREENDSWLPFTQRTETIKRKKKEPVSIHFYENLHGVLDGDPNEEGYYLATRWAPGDSGALAVKALMGMWDVKTIDEAMASLGTIESAWDFVIADDKDNIGFQMSGLAPRRRKGISGLIPVPGWKKENDWQGFLTVEEMPRCKNPEKGFFATANQDLNEFGKEKPINMPMGSYRADRIAHLLEQRDKLTPEDMFDMHKDLYSIQAELFMKILEPLLPDTPQGKLLKEWDFYYDAQSQGAFLFEAFYKTLYNEVFGENGIGEKVVTHLLEGDSIYIDFYQNLDKVLLSETSTWFAGESRDDIFKRVAEESLQVEPKTWGDAQQFMMSHIIFGGKLPRILGFDRGPLTGVGGRATIHQGQIYKSAGRITTFMPGYRFVIPMEEEKTYSNLAGGPSDRRYSKWYCSDLENWLNYRYKAVSPF
jgi:penicillin amidase